MGSELERENKAKKKKKKMVLRAGFEGDMVCFWTMLLRERDLLWGLFVVYLYKQFVCVLYRAVLMVKNKSGYNRINLAGFRGV